LQRCTPSLAAMRFSRIHFAVLEISGKATRWPRRLADECDDIRRVWENAHGPLINIRPCLYGPGGRLWKISAQKDLTREAMTDLRIYLTGLLINEHSP
jgi:hypothetical protein